MRAARFHTDFDSGVNMVRALGRFLRGRDHGAMSVGPASPLLADVAAKLPYAVRRRAYIGMGLQQGVPLHRVHDVRSEDIAHWITEQYGPGPYPVIVIGSASGAVLHLAAALGAPYLPQTTLVSVRDRATHPDDPADAIDRLAPITRLLARNNPDISVYHMHDPAQDRPMLQGMAYMRLKRARLGDRLRRFIAERLAPGGTVIQVECTRTWRSRAVGERAYFQFGCLGGVSEEEYHNSGGRIAEYLAAEGSEYRVWEPPESDARRAEAEWGFDDALSAEVRELADTHGFTVRRLVAEEPQEFSPLVADLHRWWYGRLDRPTDRLLAECYVQWDPMWVLRLGVVPFWLRFNMEPSYQEFAGYLADAEPYRTIHLNLFSQGLRSPGVVGIDRWRKLIQEHAREHGEIIGVDERSYPADLGSSLRFQPAFAELPGRFPIPSPLRVDDIDTFVEGYAADGRVSWR
ncbi:hypothetical protein [Phytoactinopolyspora halotolerans]|uniref:Uncharacterized protein n=1 Tax=Phytoactinopolyspora halotolerans TaxID=1981512 RepID=A0A6L9SCG2_9ACTN|nr:hypothetical protein [Phytoactinopolyspora halotolerans]NEE02374.1 hypothetical protein [Phytoactinopolyspora halotolerans]